MIRLLLLAALLAMLSLPVQTAPAFAQQAQPEATEEQEPAEEDVEERIIPDDALPSLDTTKPTEEPVQEEADDVDGPPPEVQRDLSNLPEPVRRMRELILEIARTGNIERLREVIGVGDSATTLSIGGLDGDPIEFLKEASGDDDGYELLAILIEVLEAGYVHMDAGTENEMYVWPYFFAWPLNKLTPEMKVELFQVLTAGDVEDSESFGGYVFYRAGIKPDGTWAFFVAGD